MQEFIDLITGNLAFFVGLFVFVIFAIGFAIALSTASGRDALGRAAVKLAVAALGFAERWLGREIDDEVRTMSSAGRSSQRHPIERARSDLQGWLSK